MLGNRRQAGEVWRGVAVCLALLFSFSSLSILTAGWQTQAGGTMACCRSKARCCCHKNGLKPNGGPAISAQGCASTCGRITLAGVSAMVYVPARAGARMELAAVLFDGRLDTDGGPSWLVTHSLRQRPPPSFLTHSA